MGCDIHARIDAAPHNIWRCVAVLDLDRHYLLFDVLAGVRCSHDYPDGEEQCEYSPPGIARPETRGFPPGEPAHMPYVSEDAWLDSIQHSRSWLSLAELRSARQRLEKAITDCGEQVTPQWLGELPAIIAFMELYAESHGGCPMRLVFGFDN